jgi:hypothetical protein
MTHIDKSTDWLWTLDRVEEWIGALDRRPEDLAIGFISLKRSLTERLDEPDIRARSLALTHRYLDAVEGWLASGSPDQNALRLLFAELMTLLAEAGPYRYETKKDPSGALDRDIRQPLEAIRVRAVEVGKALFARPEFDPMRDSIDAEIVPLLDSVVEVFGDEHDRVMPFRVIQVGKIAERLLELAEWLRHDGSQSALVAARRACVGAGTWTSPRSAPGARSRRSVTTSPTSTCPIT